MDSRRERIIGKPSIESECCPFCGRYLYIDGRFAGNRHHVLLKGMGGTKYEKLIPTVTVCGMGNASGCHGKLHQHLLELDWDDEAGWWRYRYTTGTDTGWKAVRAHEPV